ncbi:hypothetical protein OGR47_02640 [Methylocystis sp. MJC1]|uniref:hyaluronate lyase N-terminal domain-containing protein n=1 Tax=Methylocystis sp. MJC1 TaxID=2654282 RepID=UPI0013EE0C3B|nr:hypothetical protein [Methylocystis sp. MJC1]KAF2991166.1 hypothetical protein MJC1_01899 [Methylocystis sp. MJC1]MBU6525911.1 hypothetical protein [Methylocystis sp. MJC1]UZX12377.1 hypothetical protein OGR47_02640 [Methylocystis sp. MJC1]
MTGSASQVQLRRDTNANVAAYTGPQGEAIYNTDTKRLHLQDGETAGGTPMAKLSEVVTAARTAVADANYTATATDRIIAFTSLTAARAVQLPAASAFPTGVPLWVIDESGACSGANYIAVNRNGSDTVSGATSATLNAAYAAIALESDGVSKWTVWQGEQNVFASAVGIGTPPDPSNPLSVRAPQALFNAPTDSMRHYLNKVASANDAATIYETSFAAHAQLGLLGDDNFHGKVSPDGSAWKEWLNVDKTTGKPSFPQGMGDGTLAGFRNRLRNGNFSINQRAVSGTVTLAAGAYGLDGVKAGASGCTYTFAQSGIDTAITITAGSLILPIESSMIEGGTYTLSHQGTAQARVWQGTGYTGTGSYATCPQTVLGIAANTQTNVEFSIGTLLLPQFEPGAYATIFERRPPGTEESMCYRYFYIWKGGTYARLFFAYIDSGASCVAVFFLPAAMRATPSVRQFSGMTINNVDASFGMFYGYLGNMLTFALNVTGQPVGTMQQCYVGSSYASGVVELSAEI